MPESFCAELHGLYKENIHIVFSMQRAAATKSSTAGMLQVPAARPLASRQQAADVLPYACKASLSLNRARLYSSKQRVLEHELGTPHMLPTVSAGRQCIYAGTVLYMLPAAAHKNSRCLVPDKQRRQCRLGRPCMHQCTLLAGRHMAISLLECPKHTRQHTLFNASL